ncbi:MAG: ubiquinone biosynthesis accessory factor UbiJ [Woeseiaceae bacterium]
MNALEKMLQPVTRLINRQIQGQTPACELCRELQGKIVAVRVRNTGIAMYFRVAAEEIALQGEFDGEPDAAITGSLLSLAAMAAGGTAQSGESAVRDGSLKLTGDAQIARAFQRLLDYGKPDLEEELSGIVGDVAAHGLGDIARTLRRWGQGAGRTLRQNVSEYLQEESRELPGRYEVEDFRERVDTLRDDVARMDARLKRLETLAGPATPRG